MGYCHMNFIWNYATPSSISIWCRKSIIIMCFQCVHVKVTLIRPIYNYISMLDFLIAKPYGTLDISNNGWPCCDSMKESWSHVRKCMKTNERSRSWPTYFYFRLYLLFSYVYPLSSFLHVLWLHRAIVCI